MIACLRGAAPVAAILIALAALTALINGESARAGTVVAILVDRTDDPASPAGFACATAADDDDCSLRGAVEKANNTAGPDVIDFTAAGTYTVSQDGGGDLLGDLDVTDDLTIIQPGVGDVTIRRTFNDIDGTVDRIFDVSANCSSPSPVDFTINGPNLQFGRADAANGGNGGAIQFQGDSDCDSQTDPTTIGQLTILNSTISSNQATGNGGSIYAVDADITIQGSTVQTSDSDVAGGAIYAGVASFATLTTPANLAISDSTFSTNDAFTGGGAVYLTGGRVANPLASTISNTDFFQNHLGDGTAGDGGAIYVSAVPALSITGSPGGFADPPNGIFSGNQAERHGGAIFSDPADSTYVTGSVSLVGVQLFTNRADADNISGGDGGAIFHARGTLNISDSSLGGTEFNEGNQGNFGGGLAHRFLLPQGAGHNNVSSITITDTLIAGNFAGPGLSSGGGVYHDSANADSTNNLDIVGDDAVANVQENGAVSNGGGLALAGAATVDLDNLLVIDNTGSNTGGGLWNSGATVTIGANSPVNFGGLNFDEEANKSPNGGAIYSASGTLTMTNGSFVGNASSGGGGALRVAGGSVTVNRARFVSNSSSGAGVVQTGGTASLENNWWGCDGFPGETGCDNFLGTMDFDPRIDLRLEANPSAVDLNGASTLTADVTRNTADTALAPLQSLEGMTITFGSDALGSVLPTTDTIDSGIATTTFTAGNSGGTSTVSASLDNGTQTATVTVGPVDADGDTYSLRPTAMTPIRTSIPAKLRTTIASTTTATGPSTRASSPATAKT